MAKTPPGSGGPNVKGGAVRLDVPKDGGRTIIVVALYGHVTTTSAEEIAAWAGKEVDRLAGRPFGLLFDLRKVTKFDDEAGPIMQRIEIESASKGLEAVAHLVSQPEIVKKLEGEMKAAGADKLIRNFTDESQARAFASGG
jgi:hypothetical protein